MGPVVVFLLLLAPLTSALPVAPTPSPCEMPPYKPRTPSPKAAPTSSLPTNQRWKPSSAPSFCRDLIADPRPLSATCGKRDPHSHRCQNGSLQMFSQMFQDYYLFRAHFSKLKRRGVYLDVAANHPYHLSNTYFMDACLGWSGLCVEAHPSLLSGLVRHRSCAVLPTCVSDVDGRSVAFVLKGGTSGIKSTNKNVKSWQKEGIALQSIRMTCTTLKHALEKHNVSRVDYLSLDVEGHELSVLKGIDWDQVVINVLTVECQPDTLPKIEDFLVSKGYVRHHPTLNERACRSAKLIEDAVFLHKDVEFGHPV